MSGLAPIGAQGLSPGNRENIPLSHISRSALRSSLRRFSVATRARHRVSVLTGQGAEIDASIPSGRLIFGIFASHAEFERDLIRERVNAGFAAARTRGRRVAPDGQLGPDGAKLLERAAR